MKAKYLLTMSVMLLCLRSAAQAPDTPSEPDSLQEFRYQRKGQPFPFDSGVSISERQYIFIFRQNGFEELGSQIRTAIKPIPKTIYVDKPVRQKGDGKKDVWFLIGAAAGAALGIVGITAFK